MREQVLSEIGRRACASGGARWSDALAEAGFQANTLQGRFDTSDVLSKIIAACRHYNHVPTVDELKLYRRSDRTFPSKGAISGHFRTRKELMYALAQRAADDDIYHDLVTMLPALKNDVLKETRPAKVVDGFVYLIKSGDHYKIGRSDDLDRRVKEIRIALPEAAILAHAIRTDDPPGIEAYSHRRFAGRRANGEWFALSGSDVAAFKRRKYQ